MYDLLIRNARCVSADIEILGDLAVTQGKIAAIGTVTGGAQVVIDAEGRLLTPGGIDSHAHIDQRKPDGRRNADDFLSGTTSAACGGTTTIIPFAPQHKGQSVAWAVADYHARATGHAVIDYAFHLIVTDPNYSGFEEEIATICESGVRSLKVFTTYSTVGIGDSKIIKVFEIAKRHQCLVMAHCENTDVIDYVTARLLGGGKATTEFHAASRPTVSEAEAVMRLCSFAELFNVPLMVVHVSSGRSLDIVNLAQVSGATVYTETCTHYLSLDQAVLSGPDQAGAKAMCSPPLRDKNEREAMWEAVRAGRIDVLSSDHSPYMFDETGKFPNGRDVGFDKISSGLPGLEIRLPLLMTEAVKTGRIGIRDFVRMTATNAAKIYGLYPQKGTLDIGSDADLCVWDMDYHGTVQNAFMHHKVDYTPYEGKPLSAWPAMTFSRGQLVSRYHEFCGKEGHGRFLTSAPLLPGNPETRSTRELAAFGFQL
jgi:dihydropyrimidinase